MAVSCQLSLSARFLGRLFAVLLLVRAGPLAGSEGQGQGDSGYRFDVWKVEQGLPQNHIQTILQTRDGYLWIGTRFGLARFDGVKFTTFTLANTPSMVSDNCVTLAEDLEGHLWIGTDRGLLRWEHNRFRRFTVEDGLSHNRVWKLCSSRSGGLWLGTTRGITRYRDGAFQSFTNLQETGTGMVGNLFEDREGNLWYHVETGLRLLDTASGKGRVITTSTAVAGGAIKAFYQGDDAKLWFGNENGLHYMVGDLITSFAASTTLRENVNKAYLSHILQTQDGEFWLNFKRGDGLYNFRDGELVKFNTPKALAEDQINCLCEDREGNLWIGTKSIGLMRIQRRRVTSYGRAEGMPEEESWAIRGSHDGSIWASSGYHFCRIAEGALTVYEVPGHSTGTIKSLLEDRAGYLWVGKESTLGYEGTLYRYKDGTFEDFSVKAGIMNGFVRSLYQDRSGNLWIGTGKGINRYRDGQSTRFTKESGLAGDDARAFLEDRSGRLWIGTYGGGLNVLENGQFHAITQTNGLTSNYVWSLHEDVEGALWIGTDSGLNRLKDGRLARFTKEQGLFDDLVNHLLEDDLGNFWISCNRGLYRVNRKDLVDVAEGKAATVRYVAYGESDGMITSETNGEVQPAGWKAQDGRLWFPTPKGIVMIDPKTARDNPVPPPVVIEVMNVDNRNRLQGDHPPRAPAARKDGPVEIELRPGEGKVIEFQYTGNSLVAPEKVHFSYKLEGYDTNWVNAAARRVAYYTNLRPGHYRFSVIACNNHGKWNEAGDSLSFHIAPHFYETYPFYSLCALSLMVGIYSGHRYRVYAVTTIQKLKHEQALEWERTRIARDMHDGLGASLTRISLESELARRDAGQAGSGHAHIENITSATREVFQLLDEIVWATTPKNDTLESLIIYVSKFAQAFLRQASIRCRLDIPEVVPQDPVSAETRHNVHLAAKEVLTNVVKHAQASEVWIHARLLPSRLEILIEDNGRGLPAPPPVRSRATSEPVVPSPPGGGNGLPNIKHRLESIGGRFTLESQPGGGVKATLTIPIAAPVKARPARPNTPKSS